MAREDVQKKWESRVAALRAANQVIGCQEYVPIPDIPLS